jgi:hypothetical protein
MPKLFNIAGPCNPQRHYTLPPAARLPELQRLVDGEQYFLIHAARQSGKTTCIQHLAHQLNAGGHYYALYCSLENAKELTDSKEGVFTLLRSIDRSLENADFPHWQTFLQDADFDDHRNVLQRSLSRYCRRLDRPLVLLLDEADGLCPPVLIPFITQLRNGYIDRNSGVPFPHSVALVGLRDIRDYRRFIRPEEQSLGGMSPFNIITKSMTLQNFTREEIAALYGQHTAETGQVFEEAAVKHVHEQTQGQPWLVNAIAREVVEERLARDYSVPVTFDLVHEAIQRLIKNRPVHLDNLLERLKEPRVSKIIQPLLLGEEIKDRLNDDDFLYTCDLGLIRTTPEKEVIPANPIYAEVIVRAISATTQDFISRHDTPLHLTKYRLPDGTLDMDAFMADFQAFWRQESGLWRERNHAYGDYAESAVVMLLAATLQCMVNGRGTIVREMGIGRRRIDICIHYEGNRYPIEVKACRPGKDSLERLTEKALDQLAGYLDDLDLPRGWLLIYHPDPDLTWHERLYTHTRTPKAPVTGDLLRVARREGKITDGGGNPSKTITIVGL